MRTIRIYQSGHFDTFQSVALDSQASQHVAVVLRMQPGEQLTLFNGSNQECQATILAISKKTVTVEINRMERISRESPLIVHLAPGIIKGDGMEWLIQKAVELGVTSISPLLTQHGAIKQDPARLAKKHAQWLAIAISACEQSGRNTLPILNVPMPLDRYLKQSMQGNRAILDPRASQPWSLTTRKTYDETPHEWSILVGPEGGFHPDEIQRAQAASFQSFHLGPRILRAETASIAALSVLQALEGDL